MTAVAPHPVPGMPSRAVDPDRYAVSPARLERLTRRVVAAPRAERRVTTTPMTGGRLGEIPLSTPEDVQIAVRQARVAQRDWARLPIATRAQVARRLHDLVLARQDELLDLIQLESGKARLHAFEEVVDMALVSRHYARKGAAYLTHRSVRGPYPVLSRAQTHHDPVGVVGVISPWNYPLTLPLGDTIPALVAGNAVVLRPDVLASLTSLLAAELLEQAGLPEGVLQVVTGPGSVVGQAVIEQVDYVCYTGSTEVGRRVAQDAARRLVGSSMELGGKNAMYVRADADLGRAVPGAIRAAFGSGGQMCVHAERLVLHEGVADAFLAEFLPAVRAMRLGTELQFGVDMGSLASQSQLDAVRAHVEDAVGKGAQLLAGGAARPDLGPFVHEPTVLGGVTPEMVCRDAETFGPVLSVYRVGSDEDAIALANDTAYGLNASVWSRDVRTAQAIARRIRCGTVNVNEAYGAAWGATAAPMGGMGQSGLGRRHGPEGILKYTEAQTVATQRLVGFGPILGLDEAGFAKALTLGLRALHRMGLS